MYKSPIHTKLISAALAATIVLAACGGGSDDAAGAEDAQWCRVGQRLVDDIADGDADGAERQLERLEEIEGIDDLTDLGDLEDLAAEGGEDAAADAADQLDDDLDCRIDVPEVAEVDETAAPADTEPVATEPPVTDPPATDPPVTEPVATEPPVTDPPATDPPVTEPSAPTPTAAGEALAVVEIGATGPGINRPELAQAPADVVSESGVSALPIPAGDAIAIEYSIGYDVDTFSDEPSYSSRESFTFTAATAMTIDEVRTAFVDSIIGSYDMEFRLTESDASRDEITQSAATLAPDQSGQGVPRYEVIAATSTELPGVVIIELTATESRDGGLPELTAVAGAELGDPAQLAAGLGWTLEGWRWSPGINQFNGEAFTTGNLDWAIGTGTEADVAPNAAELLAQVSAPTYEDVSADREYYVVDDNSWSIRYSDVYEGAELRASFSYTD